MTYQQKAVAWLVIFALITAFIWLFSEILLPFIAALILAYLLDPVADRLTGLGIPRVIATTLIVAGLIVFLLFLILFLAPLVVNEVRQLAAAIPDQLAALRTALEDVARRGLGDRFPEFQAELERSISELSVDWSQYATGVLQSVWSGSLAVVNFFSIILITPVVAFYLLLDWDQMVARIDSWLPRDNAPTVRRLAAEMNQVISGFLRGQGTVALLLGAGYALSLSILGLKYGLLIGLIAGLLNFVPFIGSIVGLLLSVGVALSQFWPEWIPIVAVIVIFFAGQFLEGNILQPKIVGDSIRLHPVWIIFAIFAFSYLFGLVGVLIAVPAAAIVGVLARFALKEYRQSTLYRPSGDGDVLADGGRSGRNAP
ncbi:MAG: AI-2E family transporter [Pseudomonadota bacterium]